VETTGSSRPFIHEALQFECKEEEEEEEEEED
jgi:hypothetical protein